jgi:Flp pilus assembly protein TadD
MTPARCHPAATSTRMLACAFALLALGACASAPPAATVAPAPLTGTPVEMVAAIRAAGQVGNELAVQPLRDPMVEDLREDALALERAGRYDAAAAALGKAHAIAGDDPALLQERAEAELLLGRYDDAGALAWHAWQLGARIGPLCRRHWETLRQVRLHGGDMPGAHSAGVQRDACTRAAPARY